MSRALAGRRILVTRPLELAQGLAALIREAGGEPLLYPALEIRDLADPAPLRALIARLGEFDLAVFVSPTAVRKALELAAGATWPAALRVAAIGAGTRRALEARGFREVIAPPAGEEDSEGLLALAELAAARRVAIFRGGHGRELLGKALAARGAQVEYAECYRRARPEAAPAPEGRLDAVCVSSGEALRNLVAMLGRERMAQAPLVVPNARVADIARELGLRAPLLAGPGDQQVRDALVAYFGGAK